MSSPCSSSFVNNLSMPTATYTAFAATTTVETRPAMNRGKNSKALQKPSANSSDFPARLHSQAGMARHPCVCSQTRDSESDVAETHSEAPLPEEILDLLQCLFCSLPSPSFESNLDHMRKKHGLFIPTTIDDGTQQLTVDLEIFLEYLHLVIFGYHECLVCHTQRHKSHAVQQHMMGKGHCRLELGEQETDSEDEEGNEYRDFYEPLTNSEDEFSDAEDETAESSLAFGEKLKELRKTSSAHKQATKDDRQQSTPLVRKSPLKSICARHQEPPASPTPTAHKPPRCQRPASWPGGSTGIIRDDRLSHQSTRHQSIAH